MKFTKVFFCSCLLFACGYPIWGYAQSRPSPPALSWEKVWIPARAGGLQDAAPVIKLEANIVKPQGRGPFAAVIVSHGSTGRGRFPATQTFVPNFVASEFLKHGFVIIAPMRRGRGESEGSYEESYDCTHGASVAGLENAIQDTDHVVEYVKKLPYVDSSRIILSGHSRGGILSAIYAAKRPGLARGVVNFVGGWTSDSCSERAGRFNENTFGDAGAAARVPMLFLYADNDSYYSASSIKGFASLLEKAGGTVDLRLYPAVGRDGHQLFAYPEVWRNDFHRFLDKLGFPLL